MEGETMRALWNVYSSANLHFQEKLTEEQHMRKKLEVELLQLQLKMKNYTTEL